MECGAVVAHQPLVVGAVRFDVGLTCGTVGQGSAHVGI